MTKKQKIDEDSFPNKKVEITDFVIFFNLYVYAIFLDP